MDKEKAQYIVSYFSNLLTPEEALAIKHVIVMGKMDDAPTEQYRNFLREFFTKDGWLPKEYDLSYLLRNGYDGFLIEAASRMLAKHGEKIFLNYCPMCGRLARTPMAKQCRHCAHDWH